MRNRILLALGFTIMLFSHSTFAQGDPPLRYSKNNFDFTLSYGYLGGSHITFGHTYTRDIFSFLSLGAGASLDYDISSSNDFIGLVYGRVGLCLPKENTLYLSLDIGKALDISSYYTHSPRVNSFDVELGYRFPISKNKKLSIGGSVQFLKIIDRGYYSGNTFFEDDIYWVNMPQLTVGLRI